jgi:hypothetical protein
MTEHKSEPATHIFEHSSDAIGMVWWNSLTERQRAYWMDRAGNTGRAIDAWETFKRSVVA